MRVAAADLNNTKLKITIVGDDSEDKQLKTLAAETGGTFIQRNHSVVYTINDVADKVHALDLEQKVLKKYEIDWSKAYPA